MAERPEDLNLPNSVVNRIIKDALPNSVKVSKEANAAIAKAASVFVLYATSCANNVAMKHNRKTIHGNDVISAMSDMEFDKFVRPLERSLEGWKASQQKKKDNAAAKKKDKEAEKEKAAAKEEEEEEEIEVDPTPAEEHEENKENEDEEEDEATE